MRLLEPETRTRRPGWLLLLVILAILMTSLWYREGESGIMHRIQVGTETVATPIARVGMWASSPVRTFTAWVGDLGVSRSELQELRNQNDELKARVATLEEQVLQYQQVSQLVATAANANQTGVVASIIGLPQNNWSQVITLDRGSKSGIKVGQPVVGPHGVIGQVTMVGSTYSRVRLITDQASGVASLIQRTRVEGVTRGSVSGEVTLDFIGADADVLEGDVVITSGSGGIYPRGLLVGTIVAITNNKTALYQDLTIEPADHIASIEAVMVLTGTAPASASATAGE